MLFGNFCRQTGLDFLAVQSLTTDGGISPAKNAAAGGDDRSIPALRKGDASTPAQL